MWIKTNKLCKLNWVFALKSRINPNLKPQSIQASYQGLPLPIQLTQKSLKMKTIHHQTQLQKTKTEGEENGFHTPNNIQDEEMPYLQDHQRK